ncbi:sigma E protease regulator RseP [Thalassotalea crassostreae]|uniref:sigma E protease regulator RseP n=1 Tax=Thalassotalea crassostreae TaxID=1763536 RepID=UPI0008396B8E|nr:sigma E protease regulator RseP [Thalassotalea crassostreae]
MFDFLWNLGSFIVALGLLVTVHEYGHFWVARRCGVKVETFSIGFGKTLWRTFDKHGTEYVIAIIPLGGYVKMLDERVDDVEEDQKQFAFNNKSVYQRIAIVSAGPIANFLFAIVAFYLMFLIGVTNVKPVIGSIAADSMAAQYGLEADTEIVKIDDEMVDSWNKINMELASHIGDEDVVIHTRALDSSYVKANTIELIDWQYQPHEMSAMESLGIVPFLPKISARIAKLVEDEAADKAGLLVGDEIISINGTNIYGNWQDFVDIIQPNPNALMQLEVKRNEKIVKVEMLTGTREDSAGRKQGYVGILPIQPKWPESHITELSYGPISAIGKAAESTYHLIALSFQMVGKILTGDISVSNLSGPISIAQGAGVSASIGVVYFLSFLALISINLGIINLLPLPILDGGHLLYYVIELITGREVSEKTQEVGFKIGAVLLLSLMTIAIVNDVSRL